MQNTFDAWEGAYFEHFGIRGMKWGQRRYQNEDGSLTSLGEKRYGKVGDRSRIGVKHDLNKLDREQTYAKVRYDYNNNAAKRKTAKISRAIRKAELKGNQKKIAKLQAKQKKVDETVGKAAKDYKKLYENSKAMTDKIIKSANKKGMSIHSRDCVRAVNKGRNTAISALATIGGTILQALTGFGFTAAYGTYAQGKHYRVKNDGLGINTHRSGRHNRKMQY